MKIEFLAGETPVQIFIKITYKDLTGKIWVNEQVIECRSELDRNNRLVLMRNQMGDTIQSIGKKAYNKGWKEKAGKRLPKECWFSRKWPERNPHGP